MIVNIFAKEILTVDIYVQKMNFIQDALVPQKMPVDPSQNEMERKSPENNLETAANTQTLEDSPILDRSKRRISYLQSSDEVNTHHNV